MRVASRVLMVLLALIVFFGVWGGAHFYVWARLARDPALPGPLSMLVALGLLALAASAPLSMGRVLPRAWAARVWTAAFSWMGLLFLLVLVLAIVDLGALLFLRSAQAASPLGLEGTMLARWQALGSAGVALLVGGYAFRNARGLAPVKPVRVVLDRFPRALDGFRIVQVSDLHVSPDTAPEHVAALVERVNAEEPDLIALTGDITDGTPEGLRERVAPLAKLRAKHGVFFVTGNHECYSSADGWIEIFGRFGFRTLQNERVTIGDETASFELAGVPDWRGASFGARHAPRLADTLEGRDRARELVLLAHQPRQFPEASRLDVGLQLSGHTHGGQIWPFSLLVALVEPFVAGLHRVNRSQLYVSRGTGYWGPPMRLAAPHEITRLELHAPPVA